MPQLSDLSRRTGVPDRMLRFYLRMNLLPALDESEEYDESHVRRVALVRTLLDVGGLSPAAIRRIVGRIDTSPPLHELLGEVQYALPARGSMSQDREWERARERTTALAEQRSWQVSPDNPAWQTLTQVLVTCEWLEQHDLPRLLETYAEALERVVDIEVQLLRRQPDPESAAASMVSGTVLGDVALSALRRLIHEHFSCSAQKLAETGDTPRGGSADATGRKPARSARDEAVDGARES
ncbi:MULTISPECIES: MerR family transcriptional regulator [unclassified Streptomyces]|uniref:MerR family transcriptional regulator n=1 Tax=unclassified Streptomyces TaxID=2593676 RepID=UPI0036E0D331